MIRKSSSDIIKIRLIDIRIFMLHHVLDIIFFFLHIILRIDIMKRLLNLLKYFFYFFYLLIKLLIV